MELIDDFPGLFEYCYQFSEEVGETWLQCSRVEVLLYTMISSADHLSEHTLNLADCMQLMDDQIAVGVRHAQRKVFTETALIFFLCNKRRGLKMSQSQVYVCKTDRRRRISSQRQRFDR